MTRATALTAVLAALACAPNAQAAENRVVKCDTYAARHEPAPGGPALVANVARAMVPIDLNAVQMTDRKLTRAVLVEGLWARRTETDALMVTARLVNCTDKPLVVQARSSFIDRDQMPTEPASMWRTIFIAPRATGTYQERSIAAKPVAAYLIELRSEQ